MWVYNVPRWLFFNRSSFVIFGILSCLFIAVLWSPAGKGLPLGSPVYAVFLCFLSLSHVVFRCGTWLYEALIFAFFLTFSIILMSCEK